MSTVLDPKTTEAAIDLKHGDNQIALLAQQSEGLDLSTKEGYENAKQVLASARSMRSDIESSRKTLKAFYLETGRKIDAEAKRLILLVAEFEEPLKAQRKLIDDEAARVKREAAEAADRKVREAEAAERAKIEEQQRVEREKLEAEQKAERERLEAERQKLDAEREEIRKDREKLRAEARRITDAKEAEAKAERDRLQAIEDAKIDDKTELLGEIKESLHDEDLVGPPPTFVEPTESPDKAAAANKYAAECRVAKSKMVTQALSGMLGLNIGVGIKGHGGLADFDGGVLDAATGDSGTMSIVDGSDELIFEKWMVENIEFDCDGAIFLTLESDSGDGQDTYDELAELNGWEVDSDEN